MAFILSHLDELLTSENDDYAAYEYQIPLPEDLHWLCDELAELLQQYPFENEEDYNIPMAISEMERTTQMVINQIQQISHLPDELMRDTSTHLVLEQYKQTIYAISSNRINRHLQDNDLNPLQKTKLINQIADINTKLKFIVDSMNDIQCETIPFVDEIESQTEKVLR